MKLKWSDVRLMKLRACAFALAASAVAPAALEAQNPACPTPGSRRLAIPATGVYMGIYAYPGFDSNQERAVEAREGPAPFGIDRVFALHLAYYGSWTDIANRLDNSNGTATVNWDNNLSGDMMKGRVPVVSWQCDNSAPPAGYESTDAVIASGDPAEPDYCDPNNASHAAFCAEKQVITNTADVLKEYPGPVLLRWHWEFNEFKPEKNQNCWGTGVSDTEAEADFKLAWQNIWTIFQQAGATNVMFLWNPTHSDRDKSQNFYPTNAYTVDWIGVDTYQRETTQGFSDNFGPFYTIFEGYRKPLMVGENGSLSYSQANQNPPREHPEQYFYGLLEDVQGGRWGRCGVERATAKLAGFLGSA